MGCNILCTGYDQFQADSQKSTISTNRYTECIDVHSVQTPYEGFLFYISLLPNVHTVLDKYVSVSMMDNSQ